MFMNVRDVLAALKAKSITPAEAKEAIDALKRPAPPASLQDELAASLAEALYVAPADIDPARPFSELGLDSIIGVEWVRALNQRYAREISATTLYDHPTIESLAAFLGAPSTVNRQPSTGAPAGPPADQPPRPAARLEDELAASLAAALYIDPADVDRGRPFAELGLDSIIGVEWIRALNQQYGINITATTIYDHPTVRTLAAHLAAQLGAREALPSTVNREPSTDAIAIIGLAGQFPKSPTLDAFWDNLAGGRDCISVVPQERWSMAQYFDPNPDAPGKSYSKWMGVLEEADRFDPLFFNISPAEAEWMDPQQRLFLQTSWQCIEDAGIDPTSLSGARCGVFVGCAPGDYGAASGNEGLTPEGLMGMSMSILSARIAYFLNLKGPCLAIETSCSSSLVAIAQACDSLMLGQSDVALAGGVCVLAGPRMHVMTSKAGMLSKEGRCFTFDDRADGFVPGEGVGVVLLKRLSDAVRDGDRIAGVIRGWGLNQDGRTNGITAPSAQAQMLLEKDVYERFGIDPRSIGLVEAHGTATKLGDPIEVEALTRAFRAFTAESGYCAIGSVKSNIGHLLAAAGIAGVIKVLLALRHRTLPPTIHFQKLNEHIPLAGSPFFVNAERRPWEAAPGTPRRAAVSSFGFSGTNAHLVIEEHIAPPGAKPLRPSLPPHPFAKERYWIGTTPQPSTVNREPSTYEEVLVERPIGRSSTDAEQNVFVHVAEDVRDTAAILRVLQSHADSPRIILAGEFENALERCHLESWLGFERSLKLVLPRTRVSVIAAEKGTLRDVLPQEIAAETPESAVYEGGRRFVWRIRPRTVESPKVGLRHGGTYLITGGAGGLGSLFAEHLAKRYAAKVILTGRSSRAEGPFIYEQADVCDAARMAEIVRRHGPIHGVIHAAGVIDVRSVLEKDAAAFERVLAPKIAGTLALDEALRHGPETDFVCYFSSSSAIVGDMGWCDYAVGTRFQLAYAHHAGRAAIAWPLWEEGGMTFDQDASRRLYLETSGQRLLGKAEGLAAFERLCGEKGSPTLVMTRELAPSAGEGRRPEMKGWTLEQCVAWDVKEQASTLLKIAREKLDADANLADFGFDSIGLGKFARQLSQHYGAEITPAIFFSYPTLGKLAEYLLRERRREMEGFYGEAPVETPANQPARPALSGVEGPPARLSDDLIAIIGMSGRFPQARSVGELWSILAEGRDVVDEIPAERFDWREYYGKTHCKWCGSIPGAAEFDPLFFEISPREAETMDPRQRLLLQEAWNALEDAGLGAAHIHGRKIGMFVGVEQGDYQYLAGANSGVGGNHDAILAARLSYFLNLRGPAMAINTACSSGLVAAHQACLSLRAGECDTAIAAGVNILLTPHPYLTMSQAGMLSPDGRCYAFDTRANGMVPGEAVVAVVLKRLSQAIADGDPIRAVIRGSGINYDGKTNGITAPSGASQTALLREVYERARVNPRDIDYIVTHGTGTNLGDPVEINALYDAFKGSTTDQAFCALTSTKTNLGHTFAASGLVSLVSLVEAMRHETIPASLHCEKENDYIVWASSPFFVNKANREWRRNGKPRLGAVSAFGMSGTNAHMVVESYDHMVVENYDGPETAAAALPPFFLLALSAKTEQALSEKVEDLLATLRAKEWSAAELLAMSHTLLCGRQHFEHRLAVVVSDRDQALHLLGRAGKERLPNAFAGRVARDFAGQAVIARYAEELLGRMPSLRGEPARYQETLGALADFHCQGYELPWERLHGDAQPKRIPLPTYPFAKERYWATEADRLTLGVAGAAVLHPLVQRNTSDLDQQRFTSTFTGSEPFLSDHRVQGAPVMPAVAYLEMARAAVEMAGGDSIRLENVVFARPLTVGEPKTVHIALTREGDGIAWEIYGDDEVVHSQGAAVLTTAEERPVIDLAALRAQCAGGMTPDECYDSFRAIGLEYGSAHRGLQRVAVGTGMAIADVALPAHVAESDYVLHPCLLDAALQGTIGIIRPDGRPLLPFAIDALDVFAACPEKAVAVISETADKLDVAICDESGAVCVRLRGFSVRVVGEAPKPVAVIEQPAVAGDDRAIAYLQNVMARVLKHDARRIEPGAPFEKYGIDSIVVMQLTNELEKSFGSLSKTLFFEYQTLGALAGYFLSEHRERLTELIGAPASIPVAAVEVSPARVSRRLLRQPSTVNRQPDIAIIGLSGRYPQAANLAAFWENLRTGKDCITEIPKDRWDHSLWFDPEKGKPGKSFSKWGGFLDGVDRFDPLFFNISPREAEVMDPQERLFLECVWETMEDAGYTRESLGGNTGVFVGVMYEEYQLFGAQAQILGKPLALFGSPSSIANRISYFCNFHGPSMAVDTMCSSSLTAIHLACESLRRGGCEVAVAGGVNVSIHPNKYLTLSQGQFASSKGRCESFGEGGDGYVPGEGVGAVLLKPLAKAIEDGDAIYAVIKGSALNHGGKTNGYSVPNPNAQASVVSQALRESGVPIRAVSYIEAHGTGTSLGDPIEIAGLVRAFNAFSQATSDRQFCAIGSAKSNIGHCESAAGIAGLTKVLLQMKHGMLVPSLHSETLNPHIDFASTPFVVQQELAEWRRPVVGGREYPRIAGISSFGAGGSNAHLVVEEYAEARRRPAASSAAEIIVLSARTEAQLDQQVRNLLAVLDSFTDADLPDVAYTLQVGREALEHRLALTVSSIAQLREKLQSGLDLHRGSVKHSEEVDEDMQKTIDAWVEKGKYGKLLDLWVKGLVFDWSRLHAGFARRRMSLPTYPFARERYWAPLPELLTGGVAAALHPLVQRNTSDLSGQRFTSTFTGDEPFLADHVVNGARVLPAAAYLEMVRAAVAMAAGSESVHLENVVFARPVIVRDAPVTLHIALHAEESGAIAWQVYSDGDETVYCEGQAFAFAEAEAPAIDVAALDRAAASTLAAPLCYETFRSLGVEYGPSHRALETVRSGDGFALATIAGSNELVSLDAALQASIGMMGDAKTARIPFAIGRVEVFGPIAARSVAYLRGSSEKLDIDVADEAGRVCVRLTGVSLRSFAVQTQEPAVLLFRPEMLPAPSAPEVADVRTLRIDGSGSEAILETFDFVQQIVREKPRKEVLVRVAVSDDAPLASAVTALLATARLENPNIVPHVAGGHAVRWVELADVAQWKPWRDDGVYLISGGAGGIGLLFAREIVSQAKDAKVILTGRLPRDLGSDFEYHQVDVAERDAVVRLVADLRARFGAVHGVIHSAGVIRDGFLIKKERAEAAEVLAPKVAGVVNLDEATRELPLDFFVLFSSLSGATGNAGQADYAAANGFLDGFAHRRNALAGAGQRQGRTVSINWPLWSEGGMRVDAATLEHIRTTRGLAALETAQGIEAFYRALASGESQIAVVAGEPAKARSLLGSVETKAVAPLPHSVIDYLRKLVADALKLDVERIETDVPLDRYGIDSVLVMQLTAELEKRLGALPKTLFFEYQTLDALAGYLAKNHAVLNAAPPATPAPVVAPIRRRFRQPATVNRQPQHDIAIIGLAGRYPQAANVAQFWDNLRSGKDCITEVPKERWDHNRYFDAEKGKFGKSYSKWGGFLEGVDRFDPLFFNISPREAVAMDPQERLFVQCVWEALEDAGYTRDSIDRNTGVFVGVMYQEYQLFGAQAQTLGQPFALAGNPSFIANRVSYFCNFHGPSIALDTMCSSSLTALHLACRSLQRGECEFAVAGGVNVSIHPNKYLGLAQGQFVSSEGRCESFGEGGDGYVPGEGVGAVLLKPLAKAIADGDRIYGVIKSTAINHGGRTNGFSVPNPQAQANVIAEALKSSGVPARAVSYIEAHGTGTKLGDPIEIAGLAKAFAGFTDEQQFCAIGSAKSNIGHCESAAGIAGLTKVLMQMQHGMLAPSLHAETLNPHIDFDATPFVVQRELAEWKRPVVAGREYPRIAGISSFGAGGSNAHVVIEEYAEARPRQRQSAPYGAAGPVAVIVLSAKTEEQLNQQAANLLAALDSFTDADLPDIAYTLQIGREAMEHRLAFTASSIAEVREKLEQSIDVFRGEVKRNKEALSVFTADDELQEAIAKWIERGKYAKLLGVWVKGLAFDWNRLYGEAKPRRVALPTYPFARDRYWVEIEAAPAQQLPATDRVERYLTTQWQPAPIESGAAPQGAVILAAPETRDLAEQLAQRIPGSRVIAAGEALPEAAAWIDLPGFDESLDWIPSLQQWIERTKKSGGVALCVTRGLESGARLAGASRAGLYRMLQGEYAHLRSRHIDADAITADLILSELAAAGDDAEVRYIDGRRHRAVLGEIDCQTAAAPAAFEHTLWITGGTRGIGYLCAQHFARKYGARRIVLHGRNAPPRERIEALEALGAEARVTTIPLTDERALREEIRSWGPIGGVLHCAGVMDLDTPAFVRKSVAGIQSVLAPKVTGLDNLLRCVEAEPLQFVVLFSSVSAVMPALAAGQSDYAMANAYMDSVARHRAGTLPIVSIQWPSWKESGLGEAKSKAYRESGLLSHTDAEGLRMLDRILAARPAPVVLPAIVDPAEWRPAAEAVDAVGWLLSLAAEQLQLDVVKLDAETPLQDYGVDSVMLAQLLAPVSKRVGETLDPSILFEYPTVASFAKWLGEKYGEVFSPSSALRAPFDSLRSLRAGSSPRRRGEGHSPRVSGVASDVAVIGMACRFPGANGLEDYWRLLAEGRSAIRSLPEQRFGRNGRHHAGVLDNVTHFDPAFFQIPRSTAAAMDPQALLALETALEACAHAGYSLKEIKGAPLGVYLGARSQHRPDESTLYEAQDPIVAVGQNYLASNISRFFDFRGPSLVVDTACSSALVAMSLAMQALHGGDVEAALVGGVSLLEGQSALRMFEQRGILHPEPRFHIFDRRARGTVLGEGVGMVMLKTLDRARRDGDRVLAVIKGMAINNDGRTAGPTSPNLEARKDVMQNALLRSGKRADDIRYIDVNGSGSEVTDLIELKAIEAVYRAGSRTPCSLGSMKPNIGHPLCAEGIASLIKVVLMLHHRQQVPFLSAEEPMTHYDFSSSPFRFARDLAPWDDAPLVAAINCFADGGTNAHVILEAWEGEEGARGAIAPPALERIPLRAKPATSFWNLQKAATS